MPLKQEIITVLSSADRSLSPAEISDRIADKRVKFPRRRLMQHLSSRMNHRTLATLVRPPSKSVYNELLALQRQGHIISEYIGPKIPARRRFSIARQN